MSFLSQIVEPIILVIDKLGYLGIILGMAIESSFIPFPSEVILPPAGVLVSKGEMSFLFVLVSAIFGSLIGAYVNYFLGLHFGRRIINGLIEKYGKFMLLKKESLDKADIYFKNHGSITTFTGRLIPAIRQLISIPAGFAKMPLKSFTIYTTLGAGTWSAILIYVGVIYGNNQDKIDSTLGSATVIALICLAIIIGYYIYRVKSKKK